MTADRGKAALAERLRRVEVSRKAGAYFQYACFSEAGHAQ